MCRDDKTPFFIAALVLLASPAAGQTPCLKHEHVIKNLERQYNERVVWTGITNFGGALAEITVAPDGGTWT
ncbi:hypothetical protein LCGC14_2573540, partial [marine sediment metagenome]